MWQQKTACVGIVCVYVRVLFSLYRYHWCQSNALNRKIIKLSSHASQMKIWFLTGKMVRTQFQCLYLNNRRMICGTWACRMQRPCIIIMICLRPFESTLYSNLLSIYFDIILCVPFVKVTLCVCIQCISAALYQKPYMPKTEWKLRLNQFQKTKLFLTQFHIKMTTILCDLVSHRSNIFINRANIPKYGE